MTGTPRARRPLRSRMASALRRFTTWVITGE
jgi:hypothetical protein